MFFSLINPFHSLAFLAEISLTSRLYLSPSTQVSRPVSLVYFTHFTVFIYSNSHSSYSLPFLLFFFYTLCLSLTLSPFSTLSRFVFHPHASSFPSHLFIILLLFFSCTSLLFRPPYLLLRSSLSLPLPQLQYFLSTFFSVLFFPVFFFQIIYFLLHPSLIFCPSSLPLFPLKMLMVKVITANSRLCFGLLLLCPLPFLHFVLSIFPSPLTSPSFLSFLNIFLSFSVHQPSLRPTSHSTLPFFSL